MDSSACVCHNGSTRVCSSHIPSAQCCSRFFWRFLCTPTTDASLVCLWCMSLCVCVYLSVCSMGMCDAPFVKHSHYWSLFTGIAGCFTLTLTSMASLLWHVSCYKTLTWVVSTIRRLSATRLLVPIFSRTLTCIELTLT